MNIGLTCLCLCLLATPASAALRSGVQVWGSSMPPGFARLEGNCERDPFDIVSCLPWFYIISQWLWSVHSAIHFHAQTDLCVHQPTGSNSTHPFQERNLLWNRNPKITIDFFHSRLWRQATLLLQLLLPCRHRTLPLSEQVQGEQAQR